MNRLPLEACTLAVAIASTSFAQVTQRVSVSSSGAQANGSSSLASMSSDGRYLAFTSWASNLVPGDVNGTWDVFLRDRRDGTTVLVSVDSAGNQQNDGSLWTSVSDDGRFVAFTSLATNLVPGDTNGALDVFVRDVQNGITVRASVGSAGSHADGLSYLTQISADGRYVSFGSEATNLVPGDTNGFEDVFIRDLQNGTTERVSVGSGGIEANHRADGGRFSSQARYVVFRSAATNLVPGVTGGNVFVRDRQAGTTECISTSIGWGYGGSISADGRWVAFTGSSGIYLRDRRFDTTSFLTQGDGALISADGSKVGLSRCCFLYDSGSYSSLLLHDVATGSTGGIASGEGDSYWSGISADGSYLAFEGGLVNLVPGDTNGSWDVFVRNQDVSYPRLCDPGASGVIGCPCFNAPLYPDRACDNSSATGGASIGTSGGAFLSSDGLQITCFGQKPNELAIVVQATSSIPGGMVAGQGVRCFGGSLKRLYTRTPLASFTAPDSALGELPIHERSAVLGQPIPPGATRWYSVVYRDPIVLGLCPASSTFNTSQTMQVHWQP